MKILVTGTAGFIGYHLSRKLIDRGDDVIGLDSINDYYDVNLKFARLEQKGISKDSIIYNQLIKSKKYKNYSFIQLNLTDREKLIELFKKEKFDKVCNLAAQAGVRYSLTNPDAYLDSNIIGFFNVLENCRQFKIKNFVYASSSSVYGMNEIMPFSTKHNVDHPISLYAASKKSNELMAHSYSHLFELPTTGLRFFSAYGPWGRPDMALFIFTKSIIEGKPIDVYNNGNMLRDFTYVDDIVEGVVRVIDQIPQKNTKWSAKDTDPSRSSAPYRIYNIGSDKPIKLIDFIEAIENKLSKKAIRNYLPMQLGDVPMSWADVTDLVNELGYKPNTSIVDGVNNFIDWYRDYYKI